LKSTEQILSKTKKNIPTQKITSQKNTFYFHIEKKNGRTKMEYTIKTKIIKTTKRFMSTYGHSYHYAHDIRKLRQKKTFQIEKKKQKLNKFSWQLNVN